MFATELRPFGWAASSRSVTSFDCADRRPVVVLSMSHVAAAPASPPTIASPSHDPRRAIRSAANPCQPMQQEAERRAVYQVGGEHGGLATRTILGGRWKDAERRREPHVVEGV